jgi:hypothetical protein
MVEVGTALTASMLVVPAAVTVQTPGADGVHGKVAFPLLSVTTKPC